MGNPLVVAGMGGGGGTGGPNGDLVAAAAAAGAGGGGEMDVGLNVPPPPGAGGDVSGKNLRPISPATIQCGISDDELVSLSVRDLNRALKMRGLTRDEIVTMKQR